jgi:tetratricopeptide (TPR) repeat protein
MLDTKKSAVREHPGYWRVVSKDRLAQRQTTAAGIAKGYAQFYDGLPLAAEQTWTTNLGKVTGPDRRELFAALFNSAYKRQDSLLAQKWVDRALLEFPADMWFRKRRVEVLVQQNRLKDAVQQLESVRPADKSGQGTVSQAELSDLKCRVLLDSGDVSGFQAAIDAYIKDAPDSEFPYLMRGEAILAAGRQPANLKDALAAYTTATTKAPTDPEAWASRGSLEAELGQNETASTSLYQALSLWPRVQDGTPHLKLISLLSAADPAGLRAFHTAEYKRLRALKDGWPTALKLLRAAGTGTGQQWLDFGRLALDRHENWIALCAFQQAVKMLPSDPAGYRGLAAARWRSGWFIAALDATLRANQLDGKNKR